MADPASPPTVSAIIVVKNGIPYVREAIESVLAQTFADRELLVVDDASTDATPTLVKNYAREHSNRIRLLAHPQGANLGIAASRNLGIAAAQGRYIAFLDADDVWLPRKLVEQVAILDADPSLGMVYGRTLIWHEWQTPFMRRDYYYPLGVAPNARYDPPVLFELLLGNRAQSPTTCNAMVRADLFAKIGLFDPAARGMFEDLSFFGKALALAPAYVSDQTWAKYRQHDASCTAISSASGGDEWARFRALGRLSQSFSTHAPPPRVRRALRAAHVQAGRELARRWRRGLRRRLRML